MSRKRGWKKPPGCVVVSRPSKFGNPFTVAGAREAGYGARHNPDGSRASAEQSDMMLAEWAVTLFRQWLAGRDLAGQHNPARRKNLLDALPSLRGQDLACWCKIGAPCHADVLIELANRDEPTTSHKG